MHARKLAANAYRAGLEAMSKGDFDMARAAFRWARRADGGNPLYIHAEALLSQRSGNPYEAGRLYRRVVDMAERSFGAGHINTVAVTRNLIDLLETMGRDDEAAALRHRMIDGLDRDSAAQASLRALERFGAICLQAGRGAEALAVLDHALGYRRRAFGDSHARTAECLAATTRLRATIRRAARTTGAAARVDHTPPPPGNTRPGAYTQTALLSA